ncbi:class IV adenylate cyclase [Desulfocurvus sp. DL9XJH121]
MAANIEIKARVPHLGEVRRLAQAVAGAPPETLIQRDTFYRCPRGRLKLREFGGGARAELIWYDRPDTAGPRASRWLRLPMPLPRAADFLLGLLLGRRGVVAKTRLLFLAGRTRIHLDEVLDLGSFVELEVVLAPGEDPAAGRAEARELMRRLGLEERDLVDCAYADLLFAEDAGLRPAPRSGG